MQQVREWFALVAYLFGKSAAVKSRGGHVYTFLFTDFPTFDVFCERAGAVLFPYCYLTTVVGEYEITVDISELCRRIPRILGTPHLIYTKRK